MNKRPSEILSCPCSIVIRKVPMNEPLEMCCCGLNSYQVFVPRKRKKQTKAEGFVAPEWWSSTP